VRLVAILSWYDEPAWALTELVASLATAGVDHLVAVDGAYMLYPEGRAQSPGEQAQAILAGAQGADMGVTVHCPQDVWFGNEIEKRSFAFKAAHMVARPEVDWLWVVDADERIQEALGLRDALERTECDVATLMIDEVNDGTREGAFPLRKFFRAQFHGIHLERNHFTYLTGDGQLLFEGYCIQKPELVEADNFPFVRIDHRGGRTKTRDFQAQVYYDRRKEHGAELVPG
jgi:hypothetical protein